MKSTRTALRRLAGLCSMALATVLLAACGGGEAAPGEAAAEVALDKSSTQAVVLKKRTPVPPPAVDTGSTLTAWWSGTASRTPVTPGTWRAGGPAPSQASFALLRETDHFTFYSDEAIAAADLDAAAAFLEGVVWENLFNTNLFMPEPFHDRADKIKFAVHLHSTWGLSGGAWVDPQGKLHGGMWIGPGALRDHWGLTHEFTHSWQWWATYAGGIKCVGANTCGWVHESHANFVPHQLPEFRGNVHCSEMLANAPHLYLGSTRDRYCNWQFMEYLKDRYGPNAVSQLFTTAASDPFLTMQASRGWSTAQLNDFIGEWAMHNVTWDYKATPGAFRAAYGNIESTDRTERLRRLMPLEPLGDDWAMTRRFVSPFEGSPQRFGYNVVRLYPAAGRSTVTVRLRGIADAGANADFRWGLVATDAQFTSARYSTLQRGTSGELTFAVDPAQPLFLVVAATPSVFESVAWDQDYNTLRRYRYMVELVNAWPKGYRDGVRDACPTGTVRHASGGGCAPAGTPTTVFVGPHATVLPGGQASGSARIEDHAIVANGRVTGGVVAGLSVVGVAGGNAFDVLDAAVVRTAFYPLGFFEPRQAAAGTLSLYGDVEYRGAGLRLSSGYRSGFVDASSTLGSATDLNPRTTPAWRP